MPSWSLPNRGQVTSVQHHRDVDLVKVPAGFLHGKVTGFPFSSFSWKPIARSSHPSVGVLAPLGRHVGSVALGFWKGLLPLPSRYGSFQLLRVLNVQGQLGLVGYSVTELELLGPPSSLPRGPALPSVSEWTCLPKWCVVVLSCVSWPGGCLCSL